MSVWILKIDMIERIRKPIIVILTAVATVSCMATQAAAVMSCTLSMGDVLFGSFDVLPGSAVDTTTTASINCSGAAASTAYRFCINIRYGADGNSPVTRRMVSAGNYLNFDLYKDAARTVVWGRVGLFSGNQVDFSSNTSGNVSANVTVYARVAGGQQTAIPGSYIEPMGINVNNSLTYGSTTSGGSCPVGASTYQYGFNVTGTVITNCNVSASILNFGSSPSLISASINSTATITVQCTNTTPYSIGLDNGQNANGSQRRMILGGGNYINYGLYTDAAYSHAWTGTTSTTSCTAGVSTCYLGTGTGSNQNVTVYGSVPSQTAPASGTFTDTVVVTVTY